MVFACSSGGRIAKASGLGLAQARKLASPRQPVCRGPVTYGFAGIGHRRSELVQGSEGMCVNEFISLKDKISTLGRAEYRYDRLVCEFADHYLELADAGYEPLPEISILRTWQNQLDSIIRPSLLQAWQAMAARYGFSLGERVRCLDGDLYAVRVSCYPLENVVAFSGFGIKKDGTPSRTAVTVTANEETVFERMGGCLPRAVLEPLYFEGSTRIQAVRTFLASHAADARPSGSSHPHGG